MKFPDTDFHDIEIPRNGGSLIYKFPCVDRFWCGSSLLLKLMFSNIEVLLFF